MRLKSIEMQGFKSFADKIYLDFNPGITAIVGPNGSGKSNISDAIRWVMGEQSIKSLRGSKMEDVIFSGTESRKALGFAEVTLVLDNSDGYFSLDFPEITVTRRVYRSGEGEYYINKTLCRLKDIHELFMDTGLGRDGYSIIGQGKIDSILSSKSEDRRQIFEEAAGISKYKYRKIEAERKLVHTTDNLTRIEDILGELESRLGPLERQSEKARKYLLLRDEMRGLDIAVSVINTQKAKEELSNVNENIEILNTQINDVKLSLSAADTEISKMYEKLSVYDSDIENCRESDKTAVNLINEKQNNVTLLQSDIEHNEENILRLEKEISTAMDEAARIDSIAAEYSESLESLNAKNAGTAQSLEELTVESQKTDKAASDKNTTLEDIKSRIIDINAEINSLEASNSSLDMLAENFLKRQSEVEEEVTGKSKSRDELMQSKNEILQQIDVCKCELKQCHDNLSDMENTISVSEIQQKKLEESKNQHIIAANQKKTRKNMLEDMEREYEGYARGVKSVMTAYEKGEISNAKIYGPLAQLIRTDKKYIVAIETALGAANQNIVTASESDAKEAISFLKKHKSGRATFLPISAIKPRSFDSEQVKRILGFISVASDLVRCDDRYRNIISSFLGNTVICDNLNNAVEMAKKTSHKFRIVTLEGDVIQPGGAMTGGSQGKTTGSLSRAGEIESLEKEVLKLQEAIETETKELLALSDKIDVKKEKIKSKNLIAQEKGQELVKLNSESEHLDVLLSNIELSSEQLENELKEINIRISEIKLEKEERTTVIEEKFKLCKELEHQIVSVQKEYDELSGKNGLLISRLTELNITRNTILKDIELQNDRIARLNKEKIQHLDAIAAKTGDIQTLRIKNDSEAKEILLLKEEITKLESSLEEYHNNIDFLSSERVKAENYIRERQKWVKDVQEQMFGLTQQQGKLESQSEKYQLEIENIVNRLWEEYELTYSEASEIKPNDDFNYKTASAKIRDLKEKIRSLGNINIDAIEEYKAIKERFDFLSVQSSDLKKAKGELEAVITDMQQIMQSRFAEQFKVINENFNRVFGELFGGGRANLILTEPENILESGIEIEAQPPGKKLQSLTLLSGGERAFTAIALLFAILDVRPTPFCILDEIEAALDDVNVYRTADYLKQYSRKTQFIVVTHRRGTMEAANILYGVTMQERGISKLLSLNIDDVQ